MEITRTVVVSIGELLNLMTQQIDRHLAVAINQSQQLKFLEICLEEFFYGFDGEDELRELLEAWGLQDDAMWESMGVMRRRSWETVQMALGIIYPGRRYSYHIRGGDLVVREALVGDSRPSIASFINRLPDETDYVPERLRLRN